MIKNVRQLEWQRRPYTKFEHEANQGIAYLWRYAPVRRTGKWKLRKYTLHVSIALVL